MTEPNDAGPGTRPQPSPPQPGGTAPGGRPAEPNGTGPHAPGVTPEQNDTEHPAPNDTQQPYGTEQAPGGPYSQTPGDPNGEAPGDPNGQAAGDPNGQAAGGPYGQMPGDPNGQAPGGPYGPGQVPGQPGSGMRLPPTEPERGGRRSLLMAIGGLVVMFLPVPGFPLLGMGVLIASIVVGVRARRRARRILTRAPGAVGGIVIGSVGLVMCACVLAMAAYLSNELGGYLDCKGSAITETDKSDCQHKYFPRIERKLHLPAGYLSKHAAGSL